VVLVLALVALGDLLVAHILVSGSASTLRQKKISQKEEKGFVYMMFF
jgi:hypothetical protein